MNSFCKTMSLFLILSAASLAFAQNTGISGTIADSNSGALPGAIVNAVHTPTGTNYSSVSRADGRYNILNMRIGGPYTVTVAMTGFKTQKQEEIFLKLGENKKLSFNLHTETVEESLVVVASSNPLINPSRTGAFSNVTTENLEKLPTINRSLADYARTNSYFTPDRENGSLSVGGRNNRYNSIQIDGSANTDLFGLAGSNTPGGQTESQPISIDAIAELELIVSPYDVRYGGFTGGGINAVTRGGTNSMDGSVYGFFRDSDYVGDGPEDTDFGDFKNTQVGARIGGAIIKDKLFYFVNVEQSRQDQPSDWQITDTEPQDAQEFGYSDMADRFLEILDRVYGYDPGGYGEFTRKTDSDNVFVRLDWNINETHRLTARHNFVDSTNHSRERSNSDFEFPDGFYLIEDETNSTVFKLNSTFASFVNEVRLNYTTIKDRRGPTNDTLFPFIEVSVDPGNFDPDDERRRVDLRAGVERFSHANALDQEILEINEELTFFRGSHTITMGINLQSIEFNNLFIQDHLGNYDFRTLEDLEDGTPSRYQHSYSLTDDPLDAADVKLKQYGFYVGDEWAVSNNFNLILGLRAEAPKFDEAPTRNPVTEAAFGVRTDEIPDNGFQPSPRIGFNWDIKGDGRSQVRGGTGVFSGRPIYVWLSNNYANTGVEFARIDAFFDSNTPFFETDTTNQPREGLPTTDATSTEFNLIDPNFKYPSVWRTSLGYDQELPWWGMIGTAEFVYTDNLEEIVYRNLNLQASGTRAYDGRVVMEAVDDSLGPAYYLTNTDKGYSWNGTFKLERPSNNGLGWTVSYTTGESRTLLDATSSRAVSNYRNLETTGNSNENTMGRSDFEIKHRYVASATYTKEWLKNSPTTFSLFYNLRSGRPYSSTYSTDRSQDDVNNDGNDFNDLIYVPADSSEIILEDDNWDELNAYIEGDPGLRNYRGQIVPRNSSRDPWNSLLDLRIAQEFGFSGSRLQLSLDIQNFGNLLDSDSGHVRRVRFNSNSVLRLEDYNEDGDPVFSFSPRYDDDGNFVRTETLDTLSRWYMKLGARWSF